MSETIVRIMSTGDLTKALVAAFGKYGRRPARVVACPLQIAKWSEDLNGVNRSLRREPVPMIVYFMGVPLVPGAKDAKPELIWSEPIEAGV